MGVILFIVASLLLFILTIPMIIVSVFILGKKSGKYFYDLAFAIDQLGNVLCAPVFNILFLHNQNKGKLFGNPDETISHCVGVNYLEGNLTISGLVLKWVLNKIDPNHVEKAANNNQ